MTHAFAPMTLTPAKLDRRPALQSPAVAHCQQAWERAYRNGMKREKNRILARQVAGDAFLRALPPLSGNENISNFIACVTFAIASGVLKQETCTKLLYAAQLAHHVASPKQRIQ